MALLLPGQNLSRRPSQLVKGHEESNTTNHFKKPHLQKTQFLRLSINASKETKLGWDFLNLGQVLETQITEFTYMEDASTVY